MKKLLSFLAAGALALGLVGCSGDLHDVPDPNKMEGNWFYYELDTSSATDDTISIIFSDGGDYQTADITGVAKTGSVHYLWAAATKSDAVVTSLRSDNPDKGFAKDKLGVYVFTNAAKCMLWAWDSGANFTGGSWPGVAMQSDTAEALPKFSVKGIKLTGYTEKIGKAGYIAFLESWMPNNEWGATTPNKVTAPDADGNYVLTFNPAAELDYVADMMLKIQMVNPESDATFWDNKIAGGTIDVVVPESVVGKSITVVVTVESDEGGDFATITFE